MPRRAAYRTPAIEDFARQLAFAPTDAVARQVESAERLVDELLAERSRGDDSDEAPSTRGRSYPLEYVIWRLTGFRAENVAPQAIDADALLADLVTFILRSSERLDLAADARPGGAVTVGELAREVEVAERTLRRWRDLGLVAHRVRFPDGRRRVGVFRSTYRAFADRNPGLIAEATGFSRMNVATVRTALERVRSLTASGLSENLAAREAARELGRSHEAVRQLVARMEDRASPDARRRRRARAARARRLAYRAWRFGVAPRLIQTRLGIGADALRRHVDHTRAERLRGLVLTWIEFPTFGLPGAEATILGSAGATSDLAPLCEPPEAIAILERTASSRALVSLDAPAATEEAMLGALNLLKRRAHRAIAALGRDPDRTSLDRIETDLLWALRLKRRLAERVLPIAVVRAEHARDGQLLRAPADEIRRTLERCVEVVSATVDAVDPGRRQSIRRLVALESDLAFAQGSLAARASRASARHERGGIPVPHLFDSLVAWREIADPLARFAWARERLAASDRELLARRYGWDGGKPRTVAELVGGDRSSPARFVLRLGEAERRLRAAARAPRV